MAHQPHFAPKTPKMYIVEDVNDLLQQAGEEALKNPRRIRTGDLITLRRALQKLIGVQS